MGEICRDSVTFSGPRLLKIGHPAYRQSRRICLAAFVSCLLFLLNNLCTAETPVSRGEFLEQAYQVFYSARCIRDRKDALRHLEVYPDGLPHLDWPTTRGTALKVLVGMSEEVRTRLNRPAYCADIPPASPYYQLLQTLGGVFPASSPDSSQDNRFQPEALLTKKTLNAVLRTISQQLSMTATATPTVLATMTATVTTTATMTATATTTMPTTEAQTPITRQPGASTQNEREIDHEKTDATTKTAALTALAPTTTATPTTTVTPTTTATPIVTATTTAVTGAGTDETAGVAAAAAAKTARLARIHALVPTNQLAPAPEFNLEVVTQGMAEMDQTLTSLEQIIFDLAGEEALEAKLDGEVTGFLREIAQVFTGMQEKLRASKQQLEQVILIDPDSIRQCEDLRRRLVVNMQRISLLRDQIHDRLQQSSNVSQRQPVQKP